MKADQFTEKQPRHHTIQVKDRLQELIDHLRADIKKVDEPRAQALFETSAEVLIGLKTAFEHYEEKEEEAWTGS